MFFNNKVQPHPTPATVNANRYNHLLDQLAIIHEQHNPVDKPAPTRLYSCLFAPIKRDPTLNRLAFIIKNHHVTSQHEKAEEAKFLIELNATITQMQRPGALFNDLERCIHTYCQTTPLSLLQQIFMPTFEERKNQLSAALQQQHDAPLLVQQHTDTSLQPSLTR